MTSASNGTGMPQSGGEKGTENKCVSTTKTTTVRKPSRDVPNISQEELKFLYHYDPETGIFTHTGNRFGRSYRRGLLAGSLRKNGYVLIGIKRRRYFAHRLAWLYMTGRFPENEVDHINRNPSDNRFSNLRSACRTTQSANTRLRSDNSSGLRGVSRYCREGWWRASGWRRGRQLHLGCFERKEDAYEAVKAFHLAEYGEYANV